VIADISLDHQKFLGNTVGEIAREKVGIIRPGGVVVTLPQQAEANDVIGNTILELGARGVSAVQYVPPVSPGSADYLVSSSEKERLLTTEDTGDTEEGAEAKCLYRYPLQVMGKQILVETQLTGRHQLRNVALAVAAAEELSKLGVAGITAESIERGIRETRRPGRFQVLPARAGWPEIVLDVAHNPAGAWALRSALSERYDGRPLIFVFGAMRDKAISEMTEILFPVAERVIATRAENPRSASPEEIQQAGRRTGAEIEAVGEIGAALERARESAGPETVVVVTGSIYLVGEAMRILGVSA
jgi:dihydrofolate synthase/folylpolyglutamate synthase